MDVDQQRELDTLIENQKPGRGRLYDDHNNPYTQHNPFSVQAGPTKIIQGSLQRLPEPRTYGAGESVSNTMPDTTGVPNTGVLFPNISRFDSEGSGVILGGKVTKNNQSISNVSFRIWLYQVVFPLNPVESDGEPLQIRWARRRDRIGYLDFDTFVSGYDCAESLAFIGVSQSLLFSMPKGSNTLFGLVQTRSSYEAIASEKMDFFLHVDQT